MRTFITVLIILAAFAGGVGPSVAQEPAAGGSVPQLVDVSFDDVDLRIFLKIVSRYTGRRFIVDSEATGTITLIAPDQVPASELYPLAVAALESRGLGVVEDEMAVRVVPKKRAITMATPLETAAAETRGLVTMVYAARNVGVSELAHAIEALSELGKDSVRAFGESNRILLTDSRANVERLVAILEQLDVPGSGRTLDIIELRHAPAKQVAEQLNEALRIDLTPEERIRESIARAQAGTEAGLPLQVRIVPAERNNALIVVGPAPQIQQVRAIVERLDIETPAGSSRLNAIVLHYLNAKQTAEMLNTLLSKKFGEQAIKDTAIDFLENSSALIVDAPPKEFEIIRGLVQQLDVPQDQVLVEVLIAEITTSGGSEIGVGLATIEEPRDGVTTALGRTNLDPSGDPVVDFVTQGIFPSGLAFAVARGFFVDSEGNEVPKIPFLLQALAQEGRVKLLSNPMLWAQNNTEASFDVVEEIPILTSTVQAGAGTARDIIQNIDRVDVGIKLTLKPHITPSGYVQMDLNPTVEAIISQGSGDVEFTPTIARRTVKNTVTVADGDTVVISGLLREREIESVRKVPILGDIPLAGFFFRHTTRQTERTNLVMLITPHVVRSDEDAATISRRILDANPAAMMVPERSETAAVPIDGARALPR